MLKTQKVFWWRTGFANTEGKLGKEPDGEMGSLCTYALNFLCLYFMMSLSTLPIEYNASFCIFEYET